MLTRGLPLAVFFSESFAKSVLDFSLFEYIEVKAARVPQIGCSYI